jgi:protein involved in polysaccharide export with SLBB domain
MIKYYLIIMSLFTSVAFSSTQVNSYKLGAGDEIKIQVYDEPDLTVEMTINDNGKINFPLIALISVTGKTAHQVENIIHDGLQGDYLLNRPFYIHGEVKKPGAYPYKPGLNIDQAIALAGGLTERASVSKIFIKQSQSNNKKGSKVKLTYSVSPGDIITIEQSFF